MTDQQQLARGKNVMLSLLEKRLSVPRMYIDAKWQGKPVDILAVDRDGSGDVHVVLAYVRPIMERDLPNTTDDKRKLDELIARLSEINAQYKYILGVANLTRWSLFGDAPAEEFSEKTFSSDGLGRIGIVWAMPDAKGGIAANLVVYPERFRAFVGASADEFVKSHSADWEIRA